MNFETEINKTASSLALTVPGRKVTPLDDMETASELVEGPTLEECAAGMNEAQADIEAAQGSAILSAVSLGNFAMRAKSKLAHGKFTEWLETNVESVTPQWARTCMRACEAYGLAMERGNTEVLEAATTVEKLAGKLRELKGKPAIEAPKRKPAKAPAWANGEDDAEDVTPKRITPTITPEGLAKEKADLRSWEAKLDKREKELDARQADIEERERQLALREEGKAPAEPVKPPKAPKARTKAPKGKATTASPEAQPDADVPRETSSPDAEDAQPDAQPAVDGDAPEVL